MNLFIFLLVSCGCSVEHSNQGSSVLVEGALVGLEGFCHVQKFKLNTKMQSIPKPLTSLVGEIQAQRIDEVKFLLSLTNKTDQSFDNVFAYDIKSIQKQPAMDVPIQYRDEPQNIHKSQDDEEYHGAVQVRQGFIMMQHEMHKKIDLMVTQSHNVANHNLFLDKKKYEFGIRKTHSISTEPYRAPKSKIIQQQQSIQMEDQIMSQSRLTTTPNKIDFKKMNLERQQQNGFNVNHQVDSISHNLPKDIHKVFLYRYIGKKISQIADQGEDFTQVTYQQALSLLQMVNDINNVEGIDSVSDAKLKALNEDIIEEVIMWYMIETSSYNNGRSEVYRELAPISRRIVNQHNYDAPQEHHQRVQLLHNDEIHVTPDNLDYKDVINILTGRLSPRSLRLLFPDGLVNKFTISEPQVQKALQNIMSNQKSHREQNLQTDNTDDYQPTTQPEQIFSDEDSPKNLMQSMKLKLSREHQNRYQNLNRYEQICVEIDNVNQIKKNCMKNPDHQRGGGNHFRQQLSDVVFKFLEELHHMCIEAGEHIPDLIGNFPSGLTKIGPIVDQLKGIKTQEGVSIGQVLRTVLLEYKTIMTEYREDQLLYREQQNQLKLQADYNNKPPTSDKCHEYQVTKNHRAYLPPKVERTRTSLPKKDNFFDQQTTRKGSSALTKLPQSNISTKRHTVSKIPKKTLAQKSGFASDLQHVPVASGWFGASFQDEEFNDTSPRRK